MYKCVYVHVHSTVEEKERVCQLNMKLDQESKRRLDLLENSVQSGLLPLLVYMYMYMYVHDVYAFYYMHVHMYMHVYTLYMYMYMITTRTLEKNQIPRQQSFKKNCCFGQSTTFSVLC